MNLTFGKHIKPKKKSTLCIVRGMYCWIFWVDQLPPYSHYGLGGPLHGLEVGKSTDVRAASNASDRSSVRFITPS